MTPWDDIAPDADGLVVVRAGHQDYRFGYCWCGCGERTALATANNEPRGLAKGQPKRYASRGHGIRMAAKVMRWHVRDNDCWEWAGAINAGGYGRTSYLGKRGFAHRVVLRLTGIAIPAGQGWHVDHLCRNKGCVNPAHLEVVPCHINVRRGKRCKLTEAEYALLEERSRTTSAWNFAAVAEEFGVSPRSAYEMVIRASQREQRERTTQEVLAAWPS